MDFEKHLDLISGTDGGFHSDINSTHLRDIYVGSLERNCGDVGQTGGVSHAFKLCPLTDREFTYVSLSCRMRDFVLSVANEIQVEAEGHSMTFDDLFYQGHL